MLPSPKCNLQDPIFVFGCHGSRHIQVCIISRPFEDRRERGKLDVVLDAAESMQEQGILLSNYSAYSLLQECMKQKDLLCGRRIRSLMHYSGLDSTTTADHLIRLFTCCGSLLEANDAFFKVVKPSEYTWNAIITAHVKLSQGDSAVELYESMLMRGKHSDRIVYLAVLKACTVRKSLKQGRLVHEQIIKSGFLFDLVIGSTLVDMYAKCGSLEEAQEVFDKLPARDVVSWGAIIAGYSQHGEGAIALNCFEKMHKDGIQPDKFIYSSVLKACASIGDVNRGRYIHKQIVESGIQLDVVVESTLIDMYAKCGELEEAEFVFSRLAGENLVPWGAMIAGYAEHGHGLMALNCFRKLQAKGLSPDKVIFLSILKACGGMGAIEQGCSIHNQLVRCGLEADISVANALIDMYAKCGYLRKSYEILLCMPNQNVASWGAIIAGYAQSGNFELAEQCFQEMQQQGVKPNNVVFTSMLAACSHAGLVDEACKYFKSMSQNYGIIPDIYHYSCMVDLLSRTGYLCEAEIALQAIQSDFIAWIALLTSCRTYSNVQLGRRCFDQVVQLNPCHAAGYTLMSGIYSDSQLWEDAAKIEELRQHACAWKKPAKAWIEVNNQVHEFIVGDTSHPETEQIFTMLKDLSNRMRKNGFSPKIDLGLQYMTDGEKEDALCGHCERLAIAFGLISTSPGTTLRATKNLRVCINCHDATKIISKMERREIIIRDAYRMHYFKEGTCSCEDYY